MAFPKPLRAVITGGGGGLGRSLALHLADLGASVVVSDVDEAGADETASLTRERGAEAEVIACDVSDRDAVFALIEETEQRLGGIEVICNNAGVALGGAFDEISIEDWRWAVDVNLWGVIYGCQAAIPKMKSQGRGYILNVASAAGLLSPPSMAPYNVSKAGVVALSESLYTEYKGAGIHVSVLCPTFFQTNIMNAARGTSTPREEARIRKWMARSKVQAPDVAKAAIDALRDGELYVLPMADGREPWELKRQNPQGYVDLVSAAHQHQLQSQDRDES
ncbi:MAG: SDR family NAD(P)-dependent oxidoreductase [Myxococcales bacterium]|nr:SDR family NAD(P)-dependent oxidoreductase [Myxococcales bacterium]MDH3843546.1 SDR family NAD(P)-dependent oxidoreductase [Myxococcales bacterium]